MSYPAFVWATAQKPETCVQKCVLLLMANYAGESGAMFPSAKRLCEDARLCKKAVGEALQRLTEQNLLVDTGERKGRTGKIKVFRFPEGAIPTTEKEPLNGVFKTPLNGVFKTPFKSDLTSSLTRNEGTRECVSSEKEASTEAEKIYQMYPKKCARPKALKSISVALKKVPFEALLKATTAFNAVWRGATREDLQYCPHPTTWFNQERYNDDPSTWRAPARSAAPQRRTFQDLSAEEMLRNDDGQL